MSQKDTPKKSEKTKLEGVTLSELGFGDAGDWDLPMIKDIPVNEDFLILKIREGKSLHGLYAVLTIKRNDGTISDYNTKSGNTLVNQALGHISDDGKEIKGFIHFIDEILKKHEGILTRLKTKDAKLGGYHYFA